MNEQFVADYEALRRKGVIIKQKDVAEATGFSEGVISNYRSGRVKASKNFLAKFYEVFGKHLTEKKTEKIENNVDNSSLHKFEVNLTESKTAFIYYPKSTLNMKDVEILKTAIGMIGMAVEGYVNNN